MLLTLFKLLHLVGNTKNSISRVVQSTHYTVLTIYTKRRYWIRNLQ